MRIGELSEKTGVSVPTIRLYEKEGLIGPAARTRGRFREFSDEQQSRLVFIKRVRGLGFSLDDVKSLLNIANGSGNDERQAVVRSIRRGIVTRKQDLDRLENCLSSEDQLLADWANTFQQDDLD